MDEAVRSTSDWMAAIRAEENERPDAYLRDPYAHLLTGPESEATLQLLHSLASPTNVVIVRGQFGDQSLLRAYRRGVRQIVSLGAGTDTRAYRLDLPDARFFEVDFPGQVEAKQQTLARHGIRPSGQLVNVDADLREDWQPVLAKAGHQPSEPTAWIAEGLFYYLTPETADALIASLTTLSAPGSSLQLDIPAGAYYTDPALKPFLDYTEERGSPWLGQSDDPTAWLAKHGWDAESYVSTTLHDCKWLPAAPERLTSAYRHIWHVSARK